MKILFIKKSKMKKQINLDNNFEVEIPYFLEQLVTKFDNHSQSEKEGRKKK